MTRAHGSVALLTSDTEHPPPPGRSTRSLRTVLERTTLREILMGAQDNLTNVLAVVLGVAIGAGRADLVALAGLSAAVAESVSMGGVLYSSTRAEAGLDELEATSDPEATPRPRAATLPPAASGLVTAAAALVGGLIPLAPFVFLPLPTAVTTSLAISVAAIFALGSVTGRLSGHSWWRDGIRLLIVTGLAALAAAIIGNALRVD